MLGLGLGAALNGKKRGLLRGPNMIRNPSAAGAVSGSPGTLPTNWSTTTFAGLTRTVAAGDGYLDVRYQGTASNTVNRFFFEPVSVVPAALGQTWAGAADIALIAGSLAPIGVVALIILQSDGSATSSLQGPAIRDALTSSAQRFYMTATLAQVGVTSIAFALLFNAPGAPVVDFTVRLREPSLRRVLAA